MTRAQQQLEQLRELGATMRRLQLEYETASRRNSFRSGLYDDRIKAERAFDAALKSLEASDSPGPLFGGGG